MDMTSQFPDCACMMHERGSGMFDLCIVSQDLTGNCQRLEDIAVQQHTRNWHALFVC